MGHSHTHVRRDEAVKVDVARGPVTVLMVFLAICAIATVLGVVSLWPDSGEVRKLQDQAKFTAPGVSFERARVEKVQAPCRAGDQSAAAGSPTCGNVAAVLTTGPETGQRQVVGVPPAIARSGLGEGDTVRLMRVPGQGQAGRGTP